MSHNQSAKIMGAMSAARNQALAMGRQPVRFLVTTEVLEQLRHNPMLTRMAPEGPVGTVDRVFDIPVEESLQNSLVLDVGGMLPIAVPALAAAPRLRFDIRVRGEYQPDPTANVSPDPADWAKADELAILNNLAQFVTLLPDLAPEAEATVHVEPAVELPASAVASLWSQINQGNFMSLASLFEAIEVLLDAYRTEFGSKGAGREFSLAITALEEAEWRVGRGKKKAGL